MGAAIRGDFNTIVLFPFRLVNMSKFRQAIMDFRQALALDPSNPLAQQFLDSAVYQEEQSRLLVRAPTVKR